MRQRPDLYLQHLESRAGKQNARYQPPLTSGRCLFPAEPTPLQTTIHGDARLAGANFHSGQYCKVGKPVSTPCPSHPLLQPAPGTPALPVASYPQFTGSLLRRSPQFCIEGHSLGCCFSPPPHPTIGKYTPESIGFQKF